MAKVDVKNITGKSVGSIELDDAVFGAEIHEHLLWEVVKWQLAKRRAGTASTKRIGEVRGSTKKVWKQKGTGQAPRLPRVRRRRRHLRRPLGSGRRRERVGREPVVRGVPSDARSARELPVPVPRAD